LGFICVKLSLPKEIRNCQGVVSLTFGIVPVLNVGENFIAV